MTAPQPRAPQPPLPKPVQFAIVAGMLALLAGLFYLTRESAPEIRQPETDQPGIQCGDSGAKKHSQNSDVGIGSPSWSIG